LGNIDRTAQRVSWYGRGDAKVKIDPPSCQQYKPGAVLAARPQHWDGIIDEDDDDDNCGVPTAPSGGRRRPGNGNDNGDGEGEEDTQAGEKGTRTRKGTKDWKGQGKATEDWKGKGKWKGKENGKGEGIVEQTPGGDDISCAGAL